MHVSRQLHGSTVQTVVKSIFQQRRTFDDNVKMDRNETGCEGVERINPAQDRVQWRAVVNTATNVPIP
jgi:hypothetical protein